MSVAKLVLEGKEYDLPVFSGSEGETAIDIASLRAKSTAITFDPGYGNTGSCQSAVTFIDGEKGILRHRGYSIEELAVNARFTEVAHLLIYGELPTAGQLTQWRSDLADHDQVHQQLLQMISHFPPAAHPMGILSSIIAAMSTYYSDDEPVDVHIRRLVSQVAMIAAAAYRSSRGLPVVFPRRELGYAANFLRMMFGGPTSDYVVPKVLEDAMNMLLIVHADHEQNCSTSTVRMVGSSQANIYASMAAGVCALWGPLHGGANQAVLEMLDAIHADGGDYKKYMEMAKRKDSGFRLMGFGHRVYKNFDPRASLLKKACDDVLDHLGVLDPLLDIAKNLEEIALKDEFFIERKLYPNVDFYSGIIYRAMGFPVNMFTALFAIGRMPGWIAHWREQDAEGARIHRPRQIYTGPNLRAYPK